MHSEARIALAAWLIGGCGGSVHDTSVGSEPFLIIRGHVDLAALVRPHPDAPLLGAIVWAAVPVVNPVCLRFDAPELRDACPDPYGVFPGPVRIAAPVDALGGFTLPLHTLPGAGASVGDEVTRITYGSLVVLEDIDRDGVPTLPSGLRGGKGVAPGAPFPQSDVVVAATFATLRAEQTRIVLREGGFVADSQFYPAPGCPAPPAGFSILMTSPYPVDGAPPGACEVRAAGSTVEVAPLAPAAARAFACRGWSPATFLGDTERAEAFGVHRALAGDPAPNVARPICLRREVMAIVVPEICPLIISFALKGCVTDPLCAQPEWDDTAAPPSWWSCL